MNTPTRIEHLPVMCMTLGSVLEYAAELDFDSPQDTETIQQYIENLPPKDIHRIGLITQERAAEFLDNNDVPTHELAEYVREHILALAKGKAQLPNVGDHNTREANLTRMRQTLDGTSIMELIQASGDDPDESRLMSLPTNAQEQADNAVHELLSQYREAIRPHQEKLLANLAKVSVPK